MKDRNFFGKIGHGIKEFGIGALETAVDILFAGSFGGEDSAELEQFHKKVKLGKSASRIDSRTLQLAKYLRSNALPSPSASINWTKKLSNLGMLLNDQLGDCTCAAAGHMEQTWTANSGTQFIPPDSSILTAYEAVGGYVPGQPNTDNGAVEIDVLNYWRQTGIAGRKILAYVSVNVQNEVEVQQAINLFGGVYIGLAMPAAWQQTQNWTTASGLVARFKKLFGDDWDPGSWGGHAVPLVGYDTLNGQTKYTLITWGSDAYTITAPAMLEYCDECYAVISQDWLNAQGVTPTGLDLAQLQADLAQIT